MSTTTPDLRPAAISPSIQRSRRRRRSLESPTLSGLAARGNATTRAAGAAAAAMEDTAMEDTAMEDTAMEDTASAAYAASRIACRAGPTTRANIDSFMSFLHLIA